VALFFYGLVTSEIGGNLVFALIPAGVLASVAVVVSQVVRSGVSVSKAIWIVIAFASLVPALIGAYQGAPTGDLGILQGWTTGIMTMPAGFLIVALVSILTSPLSPEGTGGLLETFLVWLMLVVPGYIQWFVLLPRIVNWVKSKREDGNRAMKGPEA
jgi:hypothetical protein